MSFFSFTTMAHVEYTISVSKQTLGKIREKKKIQVDQNVRIFW